MKKILILMLLVVLTGALTAQVATKTSVKITKEQQDDLYEKARNLYISGEYCDALKILYAENMKGYSAKQALLKQINKKLKASGTDCGDIKPPEEKKEIVNKSSVKKKWQKEIFFEAQELYSNKEYDKALEKFRKIDSVNVAVWIDKINEKLDKKKKEEQKAQVAVKAQSAPAVRKEAGKEKIDLLTEKIDSLTEKVSEKAKEAETEKVEEETPPQEEGDNIIMIVLGVVLFFVIVAVIVGGAIASSRKNPQPKTKKISITNVKTGQTYSFGKERITIGRYPDNKIVLVDKVVSKYNSEITYDPASKKYKIRDLNSFNGTILNGNKIKAASLREGDTIKISSIILRVNSIS